MSKIKVAILFGGCSDEHDVSLQSAHSVITHMDPQTYDLILVGITREGEWFRYYGDIRHIRQNRWREDRDNCVPVILSPNSLHANRLLEWVDGQPRETPFDIVFPILHGRYGEDGTLQGLLELAGVPYVGCDALSSALCMDKDKAHKLAEREGIRTPDSLVIDRNAPREQVFAQLRQAAFPLMVKPIRSGSSIGISVALDVPELFQAMEAAFRHDSRILVEEYIRGIEVGCAILGNEELIVGELDEIELPGGIGFFDYTEKYTLAHARIHVPARLDARLANRIKQTAITIYRALGCSGLARVDMFVTADEEIYFNEVNTFPGFTECSRYPNMMKAIGLAYPDLIDRLIRLGLER